MSGFQFPPPPPPPPKTSNNESNPYPQAGSQGRGRGFGRGRGRGSFDGRGRGGRGGSKFSQPRGAGFANSGTQHNSSTYSNDNTLPGAGYGDHQPNLASLPPGTYVNPAFAQSSQTYQPNGSQASAISNGIGPKQNGSHNGWQTSPQSSTTPSRTVAGHKRKLEALRGPQQPDQKKLGLATAPSTPSFGNPILPSAPNSNVTTSRGIQQKRLANKLGLTPQNVAPEYSSSESDDEDAADEEAMFAELGSSLTFEHNGMVMSLNTPGDLAIWKQERAKNFPTKARMAAKMAERREIGEERKRLLLDASEALSSAKRTQSKNRGERLEQSKPRNVQNQMSSGKEHTKPQQEKKDEVKSKQTADAEEEQQDAIPNIENIADAGIASTTQDIPTAPQESLEQVQGQSMDLDTTGSEIAAKPDVTSADKKAIEEELRDEPAQSPSASDSSADPSSDISSDDGSDDDGPPEEVTSKQVRPDTGTKSLPCKYFLASGYCRDGEACRFKHELPARGAASAARERPPQPDQQRQRFSKASQLDAIATNSRKSIHDRLVEQEQSTEDQLALKVIRHLGKMGLFKEDPRNAVSHG